MKAAVLNALLEGHLPRDRGNLLAHQTGQAAREHLLALLALERRFRVVKRVFQRAEGVQQLHGGLFADARHAGNVVACVAHQALEVRNLLRHHAEILLDFVGRVAHHVGDAAPGVEHAGGLGDQLHGIAVAGDQQGADTRLLAAARHGAQNVVRLKRGAGQAADAHRVQALVQQIELRAQLRRGRLAARLVLGVIRVAERRAVHVKGDGQVLRLLVCDDLEQHAQEAEHGVGVDSIFIGKRRQRVERAVHQAVAVDDDKRFRHGSLLLCLRTVIIMITQRA